MDLINKALALCCEIEERQAELRAILDELVNHPDVDGETVVTEAVKENFEPEPVAMSAVLEPEDQTVGHMSDTPVEEPHVSVSVSADLRKSFTINDRFRFRRELFGGDDNAFADAVSRLSSCSDYSEAESVFASFGWDADNEAVAEFKDIVSKFFSGFHL